MRRAVTIDRHRTSLARAGSSWGLRILVVILVLVTGGVLVTPPGTYEATASVVLLSPASDASRHNALLSFNDDLIATAQVVREAVASKSVGRALSQAGYHGRYDIVLPDSGNQWQPLYQHPRLDLQVRATSPNQTERTLNALIRTVRNDLAGRQQAADVPVADQIVTLVVRQQSRPYPVGGRPARAVAGLLAVAVLAAVGIAGMVREVNMRRRKRAVLAGVRL